jgi:sugar phosphate isomerase/epimerase
VDLVCSLRLFKNSPLTEVLPAVRRIGFRGVELDWETTRRQLSAKPSWPAYVKKMLENNDLDLYAVCLGALTAERDDQLHLQVRAMIGVLEAVKEMGARLVIVTGGPRTLENFNCFRQGLVTLADAAVRYELEVAAGNELDTRLENPHDFRAFFTTGLPSNVGACLDVHYFHLAAVNMGDVVREQEGRIKLVRMSDMMGTLPVMPGQGEIEIRALVRTLRQAGFDGPVVLDHLHMRTEKPEREIEQAYRYLQNIVC